MSSHNSRQYRQGDVLLKSVENIPAEAVKLEATDERVVLAWGESTGHAHAIKASLAQLFSFAGKTYLEVKPEALLVHEEHSAIALSPGKYEVIIQREYEPTGWRIVMD